MEKNLSLNYEEATALLEMCMFTYLNNQDAAAESALRKLGELCRELSADESEIGRMPVSEEFTCVCA